MGTSEERREVAKRLRQMADAHDATETNHVARALGLEYKICMGCTSRMDRMEARFCKAQAGIWRHRARQLEAESQDLCSRAEALQDRIGWYRARYHELKEENRRLRAELARYAELEKKLNERRVSHDR